MQPAIRTARGDVWIQVYIQSIRALWFSSNHKKQNKRHTYKSVYECHTGTQVSINVTLAQKCLYKCLYAKIDAILGK